MQSFHHSRGRILFEVFCSFAISASCAAAWQQTGATALLPPAAVAALYGLVHAFDMRRPKSSLAPTSKSAELTRIPEPVVPATEATVVPPAPAKQPTTDDIIEHEVTEDCACGPTVEPVKDDDGATGWLIVHHSLDGRERFE